MDAKTIRAFRKAVNEGNANAAAAVLGHAGDYGIAYADRNFSAGGVGFLKDDRIVVDLNDEGDGYWAVHPDSPSRIFIPESRITIRTDIFEDYPPETFYAIRLVSDKSYLARLREEALYVTDEVTGAKQYKTRQGALHTATLIRDVFEEAVRIVKVTTETMDSPLKVVAIQTL